MPFYDYLCRECGVEFEKFHSMQHKEPVPCEECGSTNTSKIPCACGIIVRNTGVVRASGDRMRRRADAKQDLVENHGVENLTPVRGNTFESAYNDIKATGTLTRDRMQAKREQNEKRVRKKQKEWLKGARKRTPERARVKKEKKAQEAAAKRKIVM